MTGHLKELYFSGNKLEFEGTLELYRFIDRAESLKVPFFSLILYTNLIIIVSITEKLLSAAQLEALIYSFFLQLIDQKLFI